MSDYTALLASMRENPVEVELRLAIAYDPTFPTDVLIPEWLERVITEEMSPCFQRFALLPPGDLDALVKSFELEIGFAFECKFFLVPHGEGGSAIHMVCTVLWSSEEKLTPAGERTELGEVRLGINRSDWKKEMTRFIRHLPVAILTPLKARICHYVPYKKLSEIEPLRYHLDYPDRPFSARLGPPAR